MADTYTLGRLLGLLARLEAAAYGFYDKLLADRRDDQELAATLRGILADEVHHARVVREITDSLPEVRLDAPVPAGLIADLERTLTLVEDRGGEMLRSVDDTCTVIERMESLEFDVVLSFVNVSEIKYEFTRAYLQNQSVDHTNKVYRLLRSLA